jgi:hypothetical protein
MKLHQNPRLTLCGRVPTVEWIENRVPREAGGSRTWDIRAEGMVGQRSKPS